MMQKTLEYDLEEQQIRLTIMRATALIGMQRSIQIMRGMDEVKENPDEAVRVLRTVTYPDLISCTVAAEGLEWPITFEAFLQLPDELVGKWETVVYEVNPHWNPAGTAVEEQEKKA